MKHHLYDFDILTMQPDKGAAVPKFGDWDVNNPASADGFTHIFNKVREERQGGPAQVPGTPNDRPQHNKGQFTDDKVQVLLLHLTYSEILEICLNELLHKYF